MAFLINQMVNKEDDRSFEFVFKNEGFKLKWHDTGVINYHQL